MSGADVIRSSHVRQWYPCIRIRMCSIGSTDSSIVASGMGHWMGMSIITINTNYYYCYIIKLSWQLPLQEFQTYTPETGTQLTENWNYRSQIYWHTYWSANLVVYAQLMVKWCIWCIDGGFLVWIIPSTY